jgi:hypothetical protein
VFVGLLSFLFAFFNSRRVIPESFLEVVQAMAVGTFFGMGVWVFYVTLEPVVRRLWPTMLISWIRLLSGRFRDPRVGRDLLAGTVFGLVVASARFGAFAARHWLGDAPAPVWHGQSRVGVNPQLLAANVSWAPAWAIFMAFMLLLVLVLLRRVLGHPWVAAAVFVPIAALLMGGTYGVVPWGLLASLLAAIVLLLALLRFGLLAAVACLWVEGVTLWLPLTPDLSTWYAHATIVPVGFVLAMTCYGMYAATRGQAVRA